MGATIPSGVERGSRTVLTYYAWKNLLAWHRPEVCARWLVFANFFADMGEKPTGMCVRRRRPDDDYDKGNCYWGVQLGGRSAGRAKLIRHGDQKRTGCEWAKALGISPATLYKRLRRMSVSAALSAAKNKPGVNFKSGKAKGT